MRTTTALAALLSAIASAAPSGPVTAKDSPQEFDRFAKLASAAYCADLGDGTSGNLICASKVPKQCDGVEGLKTAVEFKASGVFEVAAFVTFDDKANELVISYRGTEDFDDALTDIFAIMKDASDICSNCYIHAGFKKSFDFSRDGIFEVVKSYRAQHAGLRVVATGHSLGGAVATVMAAYLRGKDIECDLYTFGSPRVGNNALAAYVESKAPSLGVNARVTNRKDIITAVPPEDVVGYQHVFPEFWYNYGTRGSAGDQPIFDASLRDGGPTGCQSEGQCTSASCADSILYLLGCKTEDHRIAQYTDNFDACPTASSKRDVKHGPRMPREMEFQKAAERLKQEVEKMRANGTYPIEAPGATRPARL